jgi:hypothetical protein
MKYATKNGGLSLCFKEEIASSGYASSSFACRLTPLSTSPPRNDLWVSNEIKMLHDILPATSKTRRGYDLQTPPVGTIRAGYRFQRRRYFDASITG